MIKNVRLKKFLVNKVFPLLTWVNRKMPKDQNNIVFYCANGELKDNSKELYLYLIDHSYDQNYKIIVCGAGNQDEFRKANDNTLVVSKFKGIFWYIRSKYVFYCAGKLPIKPTAEQMVINLWHGIPCKAIGKLSNLNNGEEFFFTYVCSVSEFYRPIMANAFGCPEENVCICGEQKTDKLFSKEANQASQKLIIWAPTFRQSDVLGYDDSKIATFLPCVDNNDWEELNKAAKERNVKLIVKLHSAQNLNGFREELYSNLEIYSDASFRERGMDLYELLAESNALIADYSSVYLQYLILDRPIGFVLVDMEEYGNTRGFVFEDPLEYMPGDKIYDLDALYGFMEKVAKGIDPYQEERRRIRDIVHKYQDGKNCERVLIIAGIAKP